MADMDWQYTGPLRECTPPPLTDTRLVGPPAPRGDRAQLQADLAHWRHTHLQKPVAAEKPMAAEKHVTFNAHARDSK